MPTYCNELNKKATVTLKKNGKTIKITSDKPPVTVTCKNSENPPDCTKIKATVRYKERSTTTGFEISGSFTASLYSPVLGIRIGGQASNIELNSRGLASGSCTTQMWRVHASNSGTSYRYLEAYIESIELLSPPLDSQPSSKGIVIRDVTGGIIFDDDAIDCDWSVQCDDDCPEGTCKCISPIYPGYCCLDCESTAANIRAITNDLRAKNG